MTDEQFHETVNKFTCVRNLQDRLYALRDLFLHEMKISSEDYCSRCAYVGTKQCAMGGMIVDGDNVVFENFNGQFTEPCIQGLYEYYKANKK